MPNPYVGPKWFEESDQGRFFGRDQEARDLLAQVVSERLVLFYAQSGAGKSSLLRAGLIPKLRTQGFEVLPIGRVSGELPANIRDEQVSNIFIFHLLLSLNSAHDAGAFSAAQLVATSLADFLAGEPDPISASTTAPVDEVQTETVDYLPTVLLIDQFEELLTTYLHRWQERSGFFTQLRQALERFPNLWVVLTLREDYIAGLDPYAHLLSNRLSTRYYMQRLGIDAALAAVQRPAAEIGKRSFAPGIAEALVDNLRRIKLMGHEGDQLGQYVEPVQLQVVCYQLWENLTAASADKNSSPTQPLTPIYITESDLKQLAKGGDLKKFVDDALGDYYERALDKVREADPQRSERQLRDWFSTQLITRAGTRSFVPQEGDQAGGLPLALVRLLQDQFLIRAEERAGGRWFELTHDRFVEPVLEANRTWLLKQSNPVTVAMRLWQDNLQDPTRLLRGAQLADAQRYAQTHQQELGKDEKDFLDACRQAERAEQEATRQRQLAEAQAQAKNERRRATALRRFAFGLAALALFALAATGFAFMQQSNASQQAVFAVTEQAKAEDKSKIAIAAKATAEFFRIDAENKTIEAEKAKAEAERQAHIAHSAQLAIQSQAVLEIRPQQRLLLAVEAARALTDHLDLFYSSAAEQALRDALHDSNSAVLRGHTGGIRKVQYSPGGKWLASVSDDNQIWVWNVEDPITPIILAPIQDQFPIEVSLASSEVSFSQDAQSLTAVVDGKMLTWNLQPDKDSSDDEPKFKFISLIDNRDTLSPVTYPSTLSPDRQWVAIADELGNIKVYAIDQPSSEPLVLNRSETSTIDLIAFSPDGSQIVAGGSEAVWLWRFKESTTPYQILKRNGSTLTKAIIFSNGNQILTADTHRVEIWNLSSSNVYTFSRGLVSSRNASAVVLDPNEQRIAAANELGVLLWDIDEPNRSPLELGCNAPIKDVKFNLDGRWLAGADDLRQVKKSANVCLWKIDHLDVKAIILPGHSGNIHSIAFSPDSKWLASGSDDKTVRYWNLETIEHAYQEPQMISTESSGASWATFSPDNRWLAVGRVSSIIELFDTKNLDQKPTTLTTNGGQINGLSFHPTRDLLASASQNGIVHIWDTTNLASVPITLDTNSAIWSVAFSPDGQSLATASDDGSIRVWQVASLSTPPIKLPSEMERSFGLAFSPDNHWLGVAGGSSTTNRGTGAELWDTDDLLHSPLRISGGANWIAFSTNKHWLATAGGKEVYISDMTNLDAEPFILRGHDDTVYTVMFSADSQRLATASQDGTSRLWATQNFKSSSLLLPACTGAVTVATFSPDEKWLATACQTSGVINLWTMAYEQLIQKACNMAGRNLTNDEWEQFFPSVPYRRTCANQPIHPSFLQQADELARSGKITAAVAAYQQALVLGPDLAIDASPLIEAANKRANSGEITAAVSAYQQALKLDPTLVITPAVEANRRYALTVVKQANELAAQGEITKAVTSYQQALKLDPTLVITPEIEANQQYAPTVVEQANDLAVQGEITKAVASYQQALQLDPTLVIDASPLVEAANTIAGSGEITVAVATYQQALQLDPTLPITPEVEANRRYAPTVVEQANELARRGEIMQAVVSYQEALQLDPTLPITPEVEANRQYASVVVEQAAELARSGEITQAVTNYQEALRLDPTLTITPEVEASRLYAPILVEQANHLAWRQEITAAIAQYQEALRLDPTLPLTASTEAEHQADLVEELKIGSVVTGVVATSLGDLWYFAAQTGQTVTISATASAEAFDVVLTLYDPDFTEILDQDDNSDGIEVIEGETLPTTGIYIIIVSEYNGGNGSYTLEVR